MGFRLREGFREFWASTVSKLGVFFLLVILAVSIYTVLMLPLDFGTRFWNDPSYWAENPKNAAPEWINLFITPKVIPHMVYELSEPTSKIKLDDSLLLIYNYTVDYRYRQFPTFTLVSISNVTYHDKPPLIQILLAKPDRKMIFLYTLRVPGPRRGESPPYSRFTAAPETIRFTGDLSVSRQLSNYLYQVYRVELTPSEVNSIGNDVVMFGRPVLANLSNFHPFNGKYVFSVVVQTFDHRDRVGLVRLVVGGKVYGLLGTDALGRDLFTGLLFGFPVALIIGFATSTLTTIIGASLGVLSGYVGGRIDTIIQRVADTVNNIPLLPLLIFLVFVFGQKLWIIVLILVTFGWPGLAIVVRSMVLQIKSAQFIEAAIAIGASKLRIMVKHVFPQVAPFVLAQLIFFTPSAILSEAALSFLGLGDPSVPTWGQILEYGFKNGAVYLGYWWWIIPPGVLIIFTAITFVFLALGMEPVVNPRLRRRR